MGDLRKNWVLQTWFRGKQKSCKEILGEKFLHWKEYLSCCIILQKSYTVVCRGKKSSLKVWGKKSNPNQTHTSTQKSNGRLQENELAIQGVYILLLDFFFFIPSLKKSSSCSWALEAKISSPENYWHTECVTTSKYASCHQQN